MTRLLHVYSVVLTPASVALSVLFVRNDTPYACAPGTDWMTLVVQYVDLKLADAHLLTKKKKFRLKLVGVVVFLPTNH